MDAAERIHPEKSPSVDQSARRPRTSADWVLLQALRDFFVPERRIGGTWSPLLPARASVAAASSSCPMIRERVKQVRLILVIFAVALIFAADFPWGDLQGHTHWAKVAWIPFVSPPVRAIDIAQNLLLGAPLGVAAAIRFRRSVTAASIIALTVSLIAEWTQLYSHSRFPSATDVVCNVSGAAAAALAVGAARRRKADGFTRTSSSQTDQPPDK